MKKIYLFLILSLTFMACQKEEIIQIEQQDLKGISTVDEKEALLLLNRYKSRAPGKSESLPYAVADIQDLHYQEIKNSNALLTVIPAISPDNSYSRILMLKIESEIQTVVMSMYPNSQHTNDFTGLLIIRSLDGVFMKGYRADNGKIIAKLVKRKTNLKTEKDWDLGSLAEVIVDAPRGEKDSVPIEYVFIMRTNDEPDRNSPDWEFIYTSGGGGGGNTTTTTEEEEEAAFNVVIDSTIYKHPCLAEVLNAVLDSNSDLFETTIAQFIDNPKYDLFFTIGKCPTTDLMCTDGKNVGTTGEIIIKIEDPTQNPIDLASQTFHEGIHAEIFRYVNEHHEGYVDPNDKPQLFDYYKHYKVHEPEPTEIDHIYMTQYYIDPIAKALRELDNNQYPLNYYKPFAWNGLRDYDPNNSLGAVDDDYSQYSNEVTANFNLNCDE